MTAVKVPEDVVCNFYKWVFLPPFQSSLRQVKPSKNKEESLYLSWPRDESCNEPILYSVEDDICKFSEWDTSDQKVSNESKSVLCFDSTVEEAWGISQYSALIGTSIQGCMWYSLRSYWNHILWSNMEKIRDSIWSLQIQYFHKYFHHCKPKLTKLSICHFNRLLYCYRQFDALQRSK